MNMIKCALQFWRKSNQHCPNHYFTSIIHKSNQIKCWFFDDRGKPEYPGKNLSWQRINKLNPHVTPGAEIEPRPHWWPSATCHLLLKNWLSLLLKISVLTLFNENKLRLWPVDSGSNHFRFLLIAFMALSITVSHDFHNYGTSILRSHD